MFSENGLNSENAIEILNVKAKFSVYIRLLVHLICYSVKESFLVIIFIL